MNPNNVQGPPPAGPPPQNHNGPPGLNFQNPAPNLQTMEELCQPTMNGRGGPIAPINIQATDFGLKNHMIQQVQNSCQFHGLPGDDANKHLDKFLTVTQSMKQNGVTDNALLLYLFLYSLTHHATAWLTLRHRDTINAAAGGTFMKRRPEECYDLIKNMTTHHNDWDTSAHRVGPPVSPSPPSSSFEEVERDPKPTVDQVHISSPESTAQVPSLVVQPSPSSRSSEIPLSPSSPSQLPKRNPHQPPILILRGETLGLANTSLTKNCLVVLLKKLHKKLGDPGKFLIPCDFPELEKCMALADLGAIINLMSLYVWKKLMLHELIPTRMTLELANWYVAYPAAIAEDFCVQVGKFTFPADFVVVDYDVDPRVPLILGRPLLRTAHALVDVYGEELILRDSDEKLIFHTHSTSAHPHKHGNYGSTNSPSDSFPSLTTFKTSDSLLEEFTDKLALNESFPRGNDDIHFDAESDLRELEYLLNQDPSIDYSPKENIEEIDSIHEDLADEPSLVDSFPSEKDYDLFDFEKDKIKDSKMKILIDELESPESNVLLPELLDYDSTLHEELPEIDTLPTFPFENEDKVFNPGILVHGSTHFVTNEVIQEKNLKKKPSFGALLILEDSNLLLLSSNRELLFYFELSATETLLSFSYENEDKVFNPGLLISKRVHSLTLELSHRSYETFKIINVHLNILNESPMMIISFFCFCPKDKGIWDESG
ncbi:reverse transcriptase domain-containing protein [Tanacetum coccineum]